MFPEPISREPPSHMLKLAYTDIGIHLEQLPETTDQIIERRQTLAARTGETIHVEPSFAAIIVPHDLPELHKLEDIISQTATDYISLCASLSEGTEIIIQGHWLTYRTGAEEGLFLVSLDIALEDLLVEIWSIVGTYAMSCTWSYKPTSDPDLDP